MIRTLREFIRNDDANAAAEYALMAATFAMVMIGTTVMVTGAASGQMNFTYTGLNNRNGVTP